MSFQEVTLVGNLGRDPELKFSPNGDAITTFSVATNRRWTGPDGSPVTETTWFRISVFGKHAEACNQYLQKGSQVLVKGNLSPDRETGGPRIWQDNEGNYRASYQVRAQTVQFLGGGSGERREYDDGPEPDGVQEDQIPF